MDLAVHAVLGSGCGAQESSPLVTRSTRSKREADTASCEANLQFSAPPSKKEWATSRGQPPPLLPLPLTSLPPRPWPPR